MKAKRLGRGLDFLLGGTERAAVTEKATDELAIDRITRNPWQPRTEFDGEALEELSQSILRHGVVQPILVRPNPGGGYELVAGERRLLAAKRAGLTTIPAVVRDLNDREMLLVALVENVQRRDLGPLERAKAFKRLVEEQNLSHQEIAEAAGLARSTVSNTMRLLELDAESMEALIAGRIGEGHARALLAEPDAGRRGRLLRRLLDDKISVRQAEDAVHSDPGQSSSRNARRPTAEAAELERRLAEKLGTKVRILERGTAGRLTLRYRTLAEFERLYSLLMGEPPAVE